MSTRKVKKAETVEQAVDQVESPVEAPQEEPKVTMADIANALRIIDTAFERGAFRGKEATTVGATRDNLERFVAHHQELQRQEEEKESKDQ